MKLKGKLIASGVALAALGVTLTSTTYAWYTNNTEVSASGLTASASSSGDSSLLISATGETGSWSTVATITATSTNLVPLILGDGSNIKTGTETATTAGTLYKWGTNNYAGTEASGTDYVEFSLYFKTLATTSDADVSVYLKSLTVKNTAGTLPTAENLENGKILDEGATAGVGTAYTAYYKDICKALAFTVAGYNSGSTEANTNYDGKTAYSLAEAQISTTSTTSSDQNITEGTNAHNYYQNATGNTLDSSLAPKVELSTLTYANGTSALVTLDKTGAASSKVTFRFYLNGADKDCFDVCKGQTFSVEFSFTSTVPTV